MKKEMFLYPWDVMDEGAQALAERLSALGVESVSLAVVYHSGKLLLPHNPKRHVLLHQDSRSYFPFDANRYGRLSPVLGELLEGQVDSFWEDTLRAFHKENIRVCAWVVLFHSDRLSRQNPDCAQQNAWGEPSPHSLCPSNEEVLQYGLELLVDIARTGVDELHLEAAEYGGFTHGAHHEMQAFSNTAELENLMGLCFCPACMERAQGMGMDIRALREAVKERAERFFALESVEPLYLEEYRQMRTLRITQLYALLQKKLHALGLETKVKPILWMTEGADPRRLGVDPESLAPFIDGVLTVYPSAPERVEAFADRIREMVPAGVPLTGGVRLMAPQTWEPRQVGQYLDAYDTQGIRDVIFYNYGMAPRPFLEALKCKKTT